MRPLEVACAALSAGSALCLISGRAQELARWLAAGALLTGIVQAVFEGAHWQIIPEYVAAVVVVAATMIRDGRKSRLGIVAISALLLDAAAAVLSILLPIFSLPAPTGAYAVGTSILYFNDASRPEEAEPGKGTTRHLKVQLWYPAAGTGQPLARYRERSETDPASEYQSLIVTNSHIDAPVAESKSPFPLVLFNPGWGSRRTSDTFLTEDLASHGYVVASIDHPYNAERVAFPDGHVIANSVSLDIGSPEAATPKQVKAIWNRELAKWEADTHFVLDRLETMSTTPGSPWFGRIDARNVGAVGHSFGGATSTLLSAEDPRVHAAVNLDGWFFAAIEARGPNQPLLFMDAQGTDSAGDPNDEKTILDATDEAETETSLRKFGGDRVVVNGAEHEDFTDQPLVSPLRSLSHRGVIPAPRIQTIVRTYVLAFLDQELRGKDSAILHPDSHPFTETSLEAWPPDNSQALLSADPAVHQELSASQR